MKALALIAGFVLSASAFANDGGVTGITVQDLKVQKSTWKDGEVTVTPVVLGDAESLEATFSEGQVKELMKLLPGTHSVVKDEGKHVKTLAIAAKEGYVTITCADATLKEGSDIRKPVWIPVAPNCTVALSKYSTPVAATEVTEMFGDWSDLSVPRACKIK